MSCVPLSAPDTQERVTFPIAADELALDLKRIGAQVGYGEGGVPLEFLERLQRLKGEFPRVCEARAMYRVCRGALVSDAAIEVEGLRLSCGSLITSRLRNSTFWILFVCTLGGRVDDWIVEQAQRGDMLDSYFANALAASAAEQVAAEMHRRIRERMIGFGLKVTNRYSPGYCDWSVADQHALFGLIGDGCCGVSLTDSALMKPVKSVSGLIGCGREVRHVAHDCRRCLHPGCDYRKLLESIPPEGAAGESPAFLPLNHQSL